MCAQTELNVHVRCYTCLSPVMRCQFGDVLDNFIFHSRSPMPRSTHVLTSVVSLLMSVPPVAPSAASPPVSCPSSPSPFSPPSSATFSSSTVVATIWRVHKVIGSLATTHPVTSICCFSFKSFQLNRQMFGWVLYEDSILKFDEVCILYAIVRARVSRTSSNFRKLPKQLDNQCWFTYRQWSEFSSRNLHK